MSSGKVICKKCGHFEQVESIPDYDSWSCPLCTQDPKKRKILKITNCGTCSQSYESAGSCPICQTLDDYNVSKFRITTDPNNEWTGNRVITEDATLAVERGERILEERIRDEIQMKEYREQHIEELLVEQNKILAHLAKLEDTK